MTPVSTSELLIMVLLHFIYDTIRLYVHLYRTRQFICRDSYVLVSDDQM